MRGTRGKQPAHRHRIGIIPAYAGNTLGRQARWPRPWDHPRVCGEHTGGNNVSLVKAGSSPRMRGTRGFRAFRSCRRGIIPAYAGNTSLLPSRLGSARDHPRVCGEHSCSSMLFSVHAGSSPRMRGTHERFNGSQAHPGIIPAYAGNTSCWTSTSRMEGDHPRVCGEHTKRL